jgi:hypothetical protein
MISGTPMCGWKGSRGPMSFRFVQFWILHPRKLRTFTLLLARFHISYLLVRTLALYSLYNVCDSRVETGEQ